MKSRLILFLVSVFVCTVSISAKDLYVAGKVSSINEGKSPVTLEIQVVGEETHQIPLVGKGKFNIRIYENERYVFRFICEGCVTKSILVDTTAPQDFDLFGTIEFDIVMEAIATESEQDRLCAVYQWSTDAQALVFVMPADDKPFMASTK
jgi:hypothetical protein